MWLGPTNPGLRILLIRWVCVSATEVWLAATSSNQHTHSARKLRKPWSVVPSCINIMFFKFRKKVRYVCRYIMFAYSTHGCTYVFPYSISLVDLRNPEGCFSRKRGTLFPQTRHTFLRETNADVDAPSFDFLSLRFFATPTSRKYAFFVFRCFS